MDAATATSHAKRVYLEAEDVRASRKSPYYWATFVHYGNTTFEDNETNYLYYLIVLVVFLTAIIVFGIKNGFFKKISSR